MFKRVMERSKVRNTDSKINNDYDTIKHYIHTKNRL